MADTLAQQISRLLALDNGSQRAALDSLAQLQGAPARVAAPPGLWCPPQLVKPSQTCLGDDVSRVSTTESVCLSDVGSASSASRASSPAPDAPAYVYLGLTPPGLPSAGRLSAERTAKSLQRTASALTISTADQSSPRNGESECLHAASSDDNERKREVTTLKIKNIPRRSTQDEILGAVAAAGFQGLYDFFFLPLGGQQSRQNRGYAFINFKDPATAARFRAAFQRHPIREKTVEVVVAPVQGVEENRERCNKLNAEGNAKAVILVL